MPATAQLGYRGKHTGKPFKAKSQRGVGAHRSPLFGKSPNPVQKFLPNGQWLLGKRSYKGKHKPSGKPARRSFPTLLPNDVWGKDSPARGRVRMPNPQYYLPIGTPKSYAGGYKKFPSQKYKSGAGWFGGQFGWWT